MSDDSDEILMPCYHPGCGAESKRDEEPDHADLTTAEAALYLNVSRSYLVGLIDARKIPYAIVDGQCRVARADLEAYKTESDAERRRALEGLAELTQELGDD